MLIAVTGNGKGKTTSALGQALRVVGDGGTALMVQFIKGPWKSGEDESQKRLHPDFTIIKGGKGFVGILGDTLPREAHEEAARETWEKGREAVLSGKYTLVIFDELHVALSLNLLDVDEVVSFLEKHKENVEIMTTGRDAPQKIIDVADLVSDIVSVKHPYDTGTMGKKGVEY